MAEVGIRALRRNASAVVARAAAGQSLVITDRGRAVAQLIPLPNSPLQSLIASGRARPARRRIGDLAPPTAEVNLSQELAAMRDDQRF